MNKDLDKFRVQKTDKTETLAFKLTPEDKKAFMDFCEKHNLKTGMILRTLLADFMKANS